MTSHRHFNWVMLAATVGAVIADWAATGRLL